MDTMSIVSFPSAFRALRVMSLSRVVILSCGLAAVPTAGLGQPADDPPAPEAPVPWTGSISAGLAVTSGNSDTQNYNAGFALTRDAGTRHLFKVEGLYLRGSTDGELAVERRSALVRHETRFSDRAFAFGQGTYLSDKFKEIDSLVSTTAGVGLRAVDTASVRLTIDAGLGAVWERNPGRDLDASGALSADQKLEAKLSDTATLTQAVSALWKLDDFGDGLFTVGVGLTASVTSRMQVKVEVIDTFKQKPPADAVVRNDVAVVLALVYKF